MPLEGLLQAWFQRKATQTGGGWGVLGTHAGGGMSKGDKGENFGMARKGSTRIFALNQIGKQIYRLQQLENSP